MMLLAILTLLSPKQQQIVENMSAMYIEDSSDQGKAMADSNKVESYILQKDDDLSKVAMNLRSSKNEADIRLARMMNIGRDEDYKDGEIAPQQQ